MKRILQVNVRLTEGGAAQVALALHQGIHKYGFQSGFAYGYAKGVKASLSAGTLDRAHMLGDRYTVGALFIQNRIFGKDIPGYISAGTKRLLSIAQSYDLVHLHAIHSYFLQYKHLLNALMSARKPVVWTLHDHWSLTGRCAFTDGCEEWRNGCGRCPSTLNYPPSLLDFSGSELSSKRELLHRFSRDTCTYVSPSKHLYDDFRRTYEGARILRIPNAIPPAFEAELEPLVANRARRDISPEGAATQRILVVAHDLSYAGKTNHELIRKIATVTRAEIITIGKNSPFHGPKFQNLGEVKERSAMAELYSEADALIFSSQVDNFPLTICEALCTGLPVFATKSAAAEEVLSYVGGACISEEQMIDCINNANWLSPYQKTAQSRNQLATIARTSFTSEAMVQAYCKLYSSLQHSP